MSRRVNNDLLGDGEFLANEQDNRVPQSEMSLGGQCMLIDCSQFRLKLVSIFGANGDRYEKCGL